MNKICWIGPIVADEKVQNFQAHSAAANLWQLNFLTAMKELDKEIFVISYVPEQTWPKGAFWVSKEVDVGDTGFTTVYTGYVNIKGIRELWIYTSHLFSNLKRFNKEEFDAVFSYNPIAIHRWIARFMRNRNISVRWISVLADDFVQGKPDLTVFLSPQYFESFSAGQKFYLEGGIEQNDITYKKPQSDPPYIVYAGTQTRVTGIREFTQVYEKLQNPPFELHIYGKGNDNEIKKIAERCDHIHLGGFVTSENLKEICSRASAFVNPRSSSREANTTFPSKLLYYIQFEKPIISSINATVDSRYSDFIFEYQTNTKEELQQLLDRINHMDINHIQKKISFFKKNNSWKNKISGLLESINNEKK